MTKNSKVLSPTDERRGPIFPPPRSTRALARDCAQYASRQRPPPPEQDPCYELFCRAFDHPPDQDAWSVILKQYRRLVGHWLGQYAREDACQRVFFRFWQAQQRAESCFSSRFPNTKTVMGFLRRCAISVRIEAHRREKTRRLLNERLENAAHAELVLLRARSDWDADDFDLKQLVQSRLKNEQEQVVFEATYRRGLPPREIQAERPDLFPDTRAVHRVKENLLKRLRRDPQLRAWWDD